MVHYVLVTCHMVPWYLHVPQFRTWLHVAEGIEILRYSSPCSLAAAGFIVSWGTPVPLRCVASHSLLTRVPSLLRTQVPRLQPAVELVT
jgi:hypothetical protein